MTKMRAVLAILACFAPGQHCPAADDAPSFANAAYGPHPRNVLDDIHGGGWTGGDKSQPDNPQNAWLAKGVSYAAMEYRLTPNDPLPAPVHDAARAIQFLRSKAQEWDIDTNRIALKGTSAGACTAMWILCHDDLADPKARDPILRQSTRVAGAAVFRGQTSIDPKQIEPWLGPNVLQHRMISMAVGEKSIADALRNYDRHREMYQEFSPYKHVTRDDPPLLMVCDADITVPSRNASHGIHHPVFGVKMKERADEVGMECHLLIGKARPSKTSRYADATTFLEAVLRLIK
jgi:arylformamidase